MLLFSFVGCIDIYYSKNNKIKYFNIMQIKVNGENPFKALKETFTVAATSAGYTLQYSADKETWTSYDTVVPADENLIVNGVTPYAWFRLKDNSDDDVVVIL